MSNHLHLIVSSSKEPLNNIIRDFKKFTARRIIEAIGNINESRRAWLLNKFAYAGSRNSNNTVYQLWKQDYHAVEIANPKMLQQRTEYIHQNPVRAGIVEHAENYLYSSARFYYNRKCLIVLATKGSCKLVGKCGEVFNFAALAIHPHQLKIANILFDDCSFFIVIKLFIE